MKSIILIIILTFVLVENEFAGEIVAKKPGIEWNNVILRNYATFRSLKDLDWGSSFLIYYNKNIIACTSREFTRSIASRYQLISINDFVKDLIFWKMYLPDEPSKYILMDSLVLKDRIEKKFSIVTLSRPFFTFALKNIHRRIIPLEPDVNRIRNKDTLLMVGYTNENKLKILQGIVETVNNEKYAEDGIRIRTSEYLNFADFIGSPVVDKYGKAVGVFSRAYRLKKDRKGRIINESKVVDGSYFEYFVEAESMRSILGKDYVSTTEESKGQPTQ